MTIKVEVIKVSTEPKGKYQVATVAYYGPDGKVDSKKLVSFKNKEVYKVFTEAQPSDVFEVTSEKDEAGYWQWTAVMAAGKNTESGGGSAGRSVSTPARTSTYETPEERAVKQVYIVRQSSLSNAIAYFEAIKGKPTVDDVVATASVFEKFVFDTSLPDEKTVE